MNIFLECNDEKKKIHLQIKLNLKNVYIQCKYVNICKYTVKWKFLKVFMDTKYVDCYDKWIRGNECLYTLSLSEFSAKSKTCNVYNI